MREQLSSWVRDFPTALLEGDEAFKDSPLRQLVTRQLPIELDNALPGLVERYRVKGSIGQGGWTHTPWLAVLDPGITDTVQEGFYVVYLLSHDAERLYLSLNQGCTTLYKQVGLAAAAAELRRRSDLMRSRLRSSGSTFKKAGIRLGSDVWRGRLYEAGEVVSIEYHSLALPSEEQLIADLREALRLYGLIEREGGLWAEDEIIREAQSDGVASDIEHAKRYRQHRSIERKSSHSRKVKRLQGTRCRGCDWEMAELYGGLAEGIIEAHHLVTLASLADGQVARFDPVRDFAVLCPNCHATIHKQQDVGDLEALRAAIRSAGLLPKRVELNR